MKYYIKDNTANTGREYIDENGENCALQENAVNFDTYAGAQYFADTSLMRLEDWGYIAKEEA